MARIRQRRNAGAATGVGGTSASVLQSDNKNNSKAGATTAQETGATTAQETGATTAQTRSATTAQETSVTTAPRMIVTTVTGKTSPSSMGSPRTDDSVPDNKSGMTTGTTPWTVPVVPRLHPQLRPHDYSQVYSAPAHSLEEELKATRERLALLESQLSEKNSRSHFTIENSSPLRGIRSACHRVGQLVLHIQPPSKAIKLT